MAQTVTSRRDFLLNTTRLAATAAGATLVPPSIAKAYSIAAQGTSGTLNDVQHIVILMQENRSFDHYFGSLRAVRGFGDPRPFLMPSGYPVWYQPSDASFVLPFHPTPPAGSKQANADIYYDGMAHDWGSTHAAWNNGTYDGWARAKSAGTMAHFDEGDLPFYHALGKLFTVCDSYHCSMLGPTDPNRLYLWTGCCGNVPLSRPHIDNDTSGYNWTTFPERLNAAGVSWKVYQDKGQGLDSNAGVGEYERGTTTDLWWNGNYGDNALLNFRQYKNINPNTPLYPAYNGTQIDAQGRSRPYDYDLFKNLRDDVANGALPSVSWVVAPFAYCEHPSWASSGGEWYVSNVLDALTSNPDVFARTVLLIMYDENDGYFDHVPPPVPPTPATGLSNVSTVAEFYNNGLATDGTAPGDVPYGLGPRVPLVVVSPWSKGGKVNSQVFDHTSVIRFIEARFGTQQESNISPWRRAVCGDLTSAFDFGSPDASPAAVFLAASNMNPSAGSVALAPPTMQSLPSQPSEPRPACLLPYRFSIKGSVARQPMKLSLGIVNAGAAAVTIVASSPNLPTPRRYTVAGQSVVQDDIALSASGDYDVSAYGPNGSLHEFRGNIGANGNAGALCEVGWSLGPTAASVTIHLDNTRDSQAHVFQLTDNAYGKNAYAEVAVAAGAAQDIQWTTFSGWHDIAIRLKDDANFLRRLAGCPQQPQAPSTDPAIGNTTLFVPACRMQGTTPDTLRFDYVAPPWAHSPKNWIGVFRAGQTPGHDSAVAWVYAPKSVGSALLASRPGNPRLAAGVYAVWYLFDDGYKPLRGPMRLDI